MTQTQFLALVRQLLSIGGGYLVGSGYLDAANTETLIGAVTALAGLGWSLWASRKVGVINAATSIPEVETVSVTKNSLAEKTASDKVVNAGSFTTG